ncbi:MAG: tripartite tricarboxylate transporter TctB family protein, partial [Rubrivivax sp.]
SPVHPDPDAGAPATRNGTRRRDWAGAFGCALAVAAGAGAIWAARDYTDLGAVFPRTVGGLLVLLGALYIAFVIAGRGRAVTALDGSMARRAAVAVVMLAWGFALPWLGFLASSAAAMAALLLVANHHRWSLRTAWVYSLSTAAVLALLYTLFKHVLQVPLP